MSENEELKHQSQSNLGNQVFSQQGEKNSDFKSKKWTESSLIQMPDY